MLFEKWLKIICRHCPNLDKLCLFKMESWFSSSKPQELKGSDSQKAQEVHTDSRKEQLSFQGSAFTSQPPMWVELQRLNRAKQETRRNSESSSSFKEAALPLPGMLPAPTPFLFRTSEALLFLQLWVLPTRSNPPHTCFHITIFFLFNLFTVNNYVYFSE